MTEAEKSELPGTATAANRIESAASEIEAILSQHKKMLEDFSSKAPGVYRWAVAAVGFMAAVMSVAWIVNPENIVSIACITVFFILLIFLLFSFEKTDIDTKLQSRILSWFSSILLMFTSSCILISAFWGWPLVFTFESKLDAARVAQKVKSFEFRDSEFSINKNDVGKWTQSFTRNHEKVYNFEERGYNRDYLLLWDNDRKIYIRIPATGGIVQWTKETNLDLCSERDHPCWIDLQGIDVKLKPAAWWFAN